MEDLPKEVTWLSGMPRSGTTWLSQVFASAPDVRLKFCPLFSYEFKNKLDETASREDWIQLFRDTYHCRSEYLDQDYLRKQGLVPTFPEKSAPPHLVIKSTRFHNLMPHLLARHGGIQLVHIVRDPRASIHSWLTNAFEFPKGADPQSEWRSGDCRKTGPGEFWGFDDWKWVNSNALRLQRAYPERVAILQYEDLTADPGAEIEALFAFCGIEFHSQTAEFLSVSQSKHSTNKRSVFKNPERTIGWQGALDAEIAALCEQETRDTELSVFLRS
ncbi:MAG: sulfotransferase [Pseudomonadota bacterium]